MIVRGFCHALSRVTKVANDLDRLRIVLSLLLSFPKLMNFLELKIKKILTVKVVWIRVLN